MFTTDLASYDSTRATDAFGIDGDIVPGGWHIEQSYFGYKQARYDANFGMVGYAGQKDIPELYFKLAMSRNFRNALVVNVIPLLVVAALLFGLLKILVQPPGQPPGNSI